MRVGSKKIPSCLQPGIKGESTGNCKITCTELFYLNNLNLPAVVSFHPPVDFNFNTGSKYNIQILMLHNLVDPARYVGQTGGLDTGDVARLQTK